jgi:cell division protein FtsA
MENKKIITGIDIGTTKVVAVIAEIHFNEQNTINSSKGIKILGIGEHPSNGLKKGIVVDIVETTKSLDSAIKIAEEKADREIEDVYVGITGDHIRGMNYNGKIPINNSNQVSGVGQEISESDVDKVREASQAINVPPGKRILHTLSQSYEVDDRKGIRNPVGLSGNTLGVNVHLVTSLINVEKDIETCFNKLGIGIKRFVLEPLASSYSVLDENEKELGVALIDIGGGTTDILVHYDGGILHSAAIPLAGNNLTLDISHRFKTTLEQAEELKINYGIGKTALASDEKIMVKGVKGRESIEITQKDLAEVIEPRMIEILTHSLDEIKKSNVVNKLNFGVVVTGGGSQLKNIIDLSQEIFNMPVKIGFPEIIDNEVSQYKNNPRYATAIGIVKYASLDDVDDYISYKEIGIIDKIKKIFNKLTNWY